MRRRQRVLVVGVGSIGERHLRCFQCTDRADVSIYEINDELRIRIAAQYGLSGVFGTWAEALASDFDAAVICTPAHLHIPMAIEIARLHRHLLIEKPLSINFDRLDELQQIVDASSITVMAAYVMRVHPALAAMKSAARFR